MQAHGYVVVNDEKILVLFRDSKTARHMKRRKTGKDGSFLKDESIYLSEHESKDTLDMLKNGETIYL